MAVQEGKKAPAFTLADENGEKVRLSDLAGNWVVLYFYPRDDTPGCTVEACDFTSGLKSFERLGAKVYGCSPDTAESHQKFIKKFKLKIHLLSDPAHKVMEKYGAWGEKNMYGNITLGVIRSTVLINPKGKVAKHWKRVKTRGHAESVRKVLEEAQSA
ncbi:MAG: peroxiredoxin [Planctomycetota bacterium]|nr:peroxiredoxin [Planctomycetota bacterium]|tara:strand:+ start:263 stop:736 length:474 start_codon:yes stop_codon:yes gene_type:complete